MNSITQNQNTETQKTTERFITPLANIFESDDSILLELDMPGVNNEQLEINFEEDVLVIKGRTSLPEYADYKTVHKEFQLGTYLRKFVVNKPIDVDKTEAVLSNGRLKIRLYKQNPVAKKIQVTIK
jgi:HSP20 family molecular chaperone IbpA